MSKKKVIAAAAIAGLLGTTAAAEASGLIGKVSGLLRNDIAVTVDGASTSMKPVMINGQAYLPARSEAEALGYDVTYDAKDKALELHKRQEEAAEYMKMTGVIQSIEPAGNGTFRIELMGRGDARWMILTADKDTQLKDKDGKPIAAGSLKTGTQVIAEYGPMVAMSYPGQSHAAQIVSLGDELVKEDVLGSVKHTDDGWQIQFGETENGVFAPNLTLTAGKETTLLTSLAEDVKWEDLKAGTKVRAFYGPDLTKSIPPQGPLFYLVVLSDNGQPVPADEAEFRDLGWKTIPSEQKPHVTTKKDEAKVEVVDAKDSGVLASTDEQKQALQKLQEAGGKLVLVTYNTDQDTLLGPLTLAFDPDSKTLIGYMPRR
ncbi:stalk domain-containing protein [Paenibacillus humicola]|uniref:stalk domain-containing protein n=1 Tax=Paenibacillus humicola TaxID=3110540 RepID=UPI00237A11A3|nr:stalk domain-containing protein [Paenibacillus humicola]